MCCGLTLPCLLGFSTGSYYVATIPKSRFEFLDSFLISLRIISRVRENISMVISSNLGTVAQALNNTGPLGLYVSPISQYLASWQSLI